MSSGTDIHSIEKRVKTAIINISYSTISMLKVIYCGAFIFIREILLPYSDKMGSSCTYTKYVIHFQVEVLDMPL